MKNRKKVPKTNLHGRKLLKKYKIINFKKICIIPSYLRWYDTIKYGKIEGKKNIKKRKTRWNIEKKLKKCNKSENNTS